MISLGVLSNSCIWCGGKLKKARRVKVEITVSFSGDLNAHHSNLEVGY